MVTNKGKVFILVYFHVESEKQSGNTGSCTIGAPLNSETLGKRSLKSSVEKFVFVEIVKTVQSTCLKTSCRYVEFFCETGYFLVHTLPPGYSNLPLILIF